MNRTRIRIRQAAMAIIVASLSLLAFISAAPLPAPTVVDNFDGPIDWAAAPSDGVSLKISQDDGRTGKAMRLDFDFNGGAGYAIARKKIDLDLAENYQFTFWMKADAPVNNFEFKLVDPTGENVWWMNRRDFHYPRDWTKITIRKRHIGFAWGPIGRGADIHKVSALELVVTAGTGGKGTVWIDDFTLTPLEPVTAYDLTPSTSASSSRTGDEPQRALDASRSSEWHSASDGTQDLTIDFLKNREFGGLTVDWDAQDYSVDYDVAGSVDGSQWETVR
ncbi:MAG: discoidin domain-containing protein, partial [Acidobacteriota bacterium]